MALQDAIVFEDGVELRGVAVAPSPLVPGAPVELELDWRGGAGGPVRIGLLTPIEAGRQFVAQPGVHVPRRDATGVWTTATLGEGRQSVSLEVPKPWHPRNATLVLERRASADAPVIEVVSGPRAEIQGEAADHFPRAVLGVVPVAIHPLELRPTRASVAPVIDGVLDDAVWQGEPHALVASLEGEAIEREGSRVWIAWDDAALYVAAELEDRDIWSEYASRDDPLYRQEAFEVFIAGDESVIPYLEFQVSPRNVIFDAAFVRYREGDEGFNGGWKHAVAVDGTLERGDRDRRWNVELAFAWPELCAHTRLACPVGPGTRLRMNVFRLDKDERGRQRGQALTPTRDPDFHAWKSAAYVELTQRGVAGEGE